MLPGSTYGLYRYSSIGAKDITDSNSSTNVKGSKAESDGWSLVSSAVTGEDGSIVFNGVDVGLVYMIKEIDSPSGYQVSKDPIMVRFVRNNDGTFTLESIDDAKGTAFISEDGNVIWYEPRLKVAVKVVDESDNPIKGATLKLICDKTNCNIREWTSSDGEELISGILQSGAKYKLVGTNVPDGYIIPENVVFTADSKPLAAGEEHTQIIKIVVRKSMPQESGTNNVATYDDILGANNNSYNVKSTEKSPKTGEKGILSYFMLQNSSF